MSMIIKYANHSSRQSFIKKRMLMLFLMLVGVCSTTMAQQLRDLYIKNQNRSTPAGGVLIFTFKTKAQAEKAEKHISNGGRKDDVKNMDGFIDSETTEPTEGFCRLKMAKNGYMVVDPEVLNGMPCEVASTKATNKRGDVIYIVGTQKDDDVQLKETLDEISVTEKWKIREKIKMVTPKACGDSLYFPRQVIPVDSVYARSNARVIVSPMITRNGEPEMYFRPSVMDGERYHNTQILRMGNDITHDPLSKYITTEAKMKDYTNSSLYTQEMKFKIDKTARYRGFARISYENYRNVYHEEHKEWWDGSVQNPMQYLEFEPKKYLTPINHERYSRPAKTEPIPKNIKGLKIKFQVGKAIIDMSDSVTHAILGDISSTISSYYNDNEAYIDKMIIKGYASPDGTQASNEDLAKKRADALREYIEEHYPDREKIHEIETDGGIFQWSDVISYIDSTYQDDQDAKKIISELKDIISEQKTLDSQFRVIRNKTWYSFVRTEVLPQLRRVDIEYRAVANRIRETHEIVEMYKQEGENYLKIARPYECYELLKYFNNEENHKELAKIAPILYKNSDLEETVVRHDYTDTIVDNKHGEYLKASKVYKRPYSLAAYCMVKEKLFRKEIDTLTLMQYIDDSNNGLEMLKYHNNQQAGYWNDESIVMLQVLMYYQAKAYGKAYSMCYKHLPHDKHKALQMYIRCMNCEWDNPEVRDYISRTSPQNKVAVLIALDQDESYHEALKLIESDTITWENEGTKWYLNALCRFRLYRNNMPDADLYHGRNCHIPRNEQDEGMINDDFAAPMLKAFQAQPEFVESINTDGYFNDSYRLLVWYFWKYMQQGMDKDDIVIKYDEARKKYIENQKE